MATWRHVVVVKGDHRQILDEGARQVEQLEQEIAALKGERDRRIAAQAAVSLEKETGIRERARVVRHKALTSWVGLFHGSLGTLQLGAYGGQSMRRLPGVEAPAFAIDSITGQLSPRFGELFDLDEFTVAALQAKLFEIKERVATGSPTAAVTTTQGTVVSNVGQVELGDAAIRPAARDELIAAFRSALGDEDYRLFAAFNREREINGVLRGGLGDLVEAFARR